MMTEPATSTAPSASQPPDESRPLFRRRVAVRTLSGRQHTIQLRDRDGLAELRQAVSVLGRCDQEIGGEAGTEQHELHDQSGRTLSGSTGEDDGPLPFDPEADTTEVLHVRLASGSAYPSYFHLVRSRSRNSWWWSTAVTLLAIVIGAASIAAGAQVSFYLPFDKGVPVTAQTLAVLLCGVTLGRFSGMMAACLYVVSGGFLSLPVFAGGSSGFAVLIGPTAGYLYGFIAAAALTGHLTEKGFDRRTRTLVLAMLAGDIAIYVVAVPWLAQFVGGYRTALVDGLLPFVPGDLVKVALAAVLVPLGWKLRAACLNGSFPRVQVLLGRLAVN